MVGKARGVIIRDIKAMQFSPPTADELALAKATLLRGISLQRASLVAIADQYLFLTMLGLPLDNADRAAQAYYHATSDNVQKAFKKWIRPYDLASVVRGPTPTW